jgi:DNA-binding MarR family transcriptional regulator
MAETKWLDETEEAAWRAFWRASRLLFTELERDLQRDAGMPPGYYEILVFLSEAPDRRLRMTDLAEATQTSPSRMTHAVTRLEGQGWIRREGCSSDRRGWNAILTDAGFAALEQAAPRHVASIRNRLLDHLTPEQVAQLRAISETLVSELRPPGCAPEGR